MDTISKINEMLKYQGVWAEEYEMQKRKRLLDKGRREKQRVKENKEKQNKNNSLV